VSGDDTLPGNVSSPLTAFFLTRAGGTTAAAAGSRGGSVRLGLRQGEGF
jgi:hypothetical protein